jgi:hypothetical protein
MGILMTVDIELVLLFKDEEKSTKFGPALWPVFSELRRFFDPGDDDGWLDVPRGRTGSRVGMRPRFSSRYLAPSTPGTLEPAAGPETISAERMERVWSRAASRDRTQQYVHDVLGDGVRELLGSDSTLLVVTDQQIVPPPEFRYIIWDVFPGGAVVSLAPLDPAYWGPSDTYWRTGKAAPDRVRAVKWRARTACLSIVGSLLGLNRCRNDNCYLFANIDSVTRLDSMDRLGQEHGVEALTDRGFPDREAEPLEVAEPVAVVGHGVLEARP